MPAKKKETKKAEGCECTDYQCSCVDKKNTCGCSKSRCETTGGTLYCFGFIGALIYYISSAPTFWTGVLGVLKALVWPAFLVYEALKFFGS